MPKIKFKLSSLLFITLVSAYFTFCLNLQFWRFTFTHLETDSIAVAVFALTLPFFIFIPLFWFFSLITVPYLAKPLIILLLLLSGASDYALQNLGIVINSDMIRNFAETTVREASDFMTADIFIYIFIFSVIPAILVWRTEIVYKPFGKELKQRLLCFVAGLLTVGLIAAASYKEYASFGRNNSEVRYYINTFNYIYAAGRYYKRSLDAKREFVTLDKTPEIQPRKTKHPRVLVLVVGETSRAANFSLYGYEQNTNPLLSQNKEITVFQHVSSCGTATAVSLPCMFAAAPRKDFDVTDAQYTQNLLDIAQSAGYDVLWLDNDDGCKKVCTRVSNTTYTHNSGEKPYCFGDYCHDDILVRGLREKLAHISKDTLIVLHTMGSHGPSYYKRYPEKFRKFTPSCDTADLQECSREEIINSYNNTIVYADYIISSVIDELKKRRNLQSGMLYVSDHGESLGEKNIYLHGLPYALAPDVQKKVPMILWLSADMEKAHNINKVCLKEKAESEQFSHDNYFHSVLRLLDIQTTAYDKKLDIFSSCN